ncbi:MAG: hypothetical protein Q9182_002287 [Xanthomendoza sp. 2 TL-2023]
MTESQTEVESRLESSESHSSSDNEDEVVWYGVSPNMRPSSRQVDLQSARDETFTRHSSLASYTEMYNKWEFFTSPKSPAKHPYNILPKHIAEGPLIHVKFNDGAKDYTFLKEEKHLGYIDSCIIDKHPEAPASSTTENEHNFLETIPTSAITTNALDVAKVIDESNPDIRPSNEEKVEEMLPSVLRGGKASSKPYPSSHSHSMHSFSPRRLTNQELHNERGAVEDVGTMMHISDRDASASDSEPGAPLAVSSSALNFKRQGHLKDKDAKDVEVLLDHRSSCSHPVYPTGAEHGDQQMANPTSQSIDRYEARAGINVNATTSVAEPGSSKAAKGKKRHHDFTSPVASPIASTLPTFSAAAFPRMSKRVKFNALTESEDPFENFNSGSEPEDDDDMDFYAPSASPSLRSKSPSPERTPLQPEDEIPASKGKAEAQRQQAAVKVKKTLRSSIELEKWPIARQARRISLNSPSSHFAATVMAERTNNKSYPLANEALRANKRRGALSGFPNLPSAGHDHETSRVNGTRPSSAKNNHPIVAENAPLAYAASRYSVFQAEYSTLNVQIRESEKEAQIEKKKLHEVEREVELLKGMIEGDDGSGVEQVRSGGDWTLIIERDKHGRRVNRWRFG